MKRLEKFRADESGEEGTNAITEQAYYFTGRESDELLDVFHRLQAITSLAGPATPQSASGHERLDITREILAALLDPIARDTEKHYCRIQQRR